LDFFLWCFPLPFFGFSCVFFYGFDFYGAFSNALVAFFFSFFMSGSTVVGLASSFFSVGFENFFSLAGFSLILTSFRVYFLAEGLVSLGVTTTYVVLFSKTSARVSKNPSLGEV
jgi:hypothetical protein